MKKVLNIAFIAAIIMCGLSSCKKSTNGIATYYGVVINEYTNAPLKGANVKITNGDKIHVLTKTSDDGSFSVEVRLPQIDNDYYILIDGDRIESKKVAFPAFGNGSYDVGTIVVKGPTKVPSVETSIIRVDSKNLVFCEGKVVDIGEAPVTERGICWGTSTPTINNKKVTCGDGIGGFSTSITVTNVHSQNLYFRAYATNEHGTAYGETVMVDHRNPYNLYKLEDQGVSYLVLPYDLASASMAYSVLSDNEAYKSCANLVAYDYEDWELPTLPVLQLMYNNKDKIGGFSMGGYWSSTKSDYHSDYFYVWFENGHVYHSTGTRFVRPVRRY